jgi:hypothetical protein
MDGRTNKAEWSGGGEAARDGVPRLVAQRLRATAGVRVRPSTRRARQSQVMCSSAGNGQSLSQSGGGEKRREERRDAVR